MKDFSFDQASKLDWSNPFLDIAIAMRLLLYTYQTRQEAEIFRKLRVELQTGYLTEANNIPALAAKLRGAFVLGPIGSTRQETEKTMNDFLSMLVPFALSVVTRSAGKSDSMRAFNQDPVVKQAFESFYRFCWRYHTQFIQNSLGGTWKPRKLRKPMFQLPWLGKKPSIDIKELPIEQIGSCFDFYRGMINLCYEYGLKCWWAPTFLFMDDLAFRAGIGGVYHEAKLFTRSWQFRLQDIPVKVHLWHEGYRTEKASLHVRLQCNSRYPYLKRRVPGGRRIF